MAFKGRGALAILGLTDEEEAFKRHWSVHGDAFAPVTRGAGEVLTRMSVQDVQRHASARKAFTGYARKSLSALAKGNDPVEAVTKGLTGEARHIARAAAKGAGPVTKGALESGDISGVVPLVVDPEIMGILKDEAPFLARIITEGQRGFKAAYTKITARGGPIGFVSENDALNLTDDTPSESTYARSEVDMEIWTDLVQISDFAQAGGEHFFNLRDTELGQRLAVYAQEKEKAILYGDPSKAQANGTPFDSNAYEGMSKIYADAGEDVDKSSVDVSGTDAVLKDIKLEIAKLLDSDKAVSPRDLWIGVSHEMFDELENEMEVRRRIEQNVNSANYGLETISIKGIHVIASHNVKQHTWGAVNTGNKGDVFVMNERAMRFRALAPLSTVPLGRRGLSEEIAMYEFGALIDRADGELGKYLKAYAI